MSSSNPIMGRAAPLHLCFFPLVPLPGHWLIPNGRPYEATTCFRAPRPKTSTRMERWPGLGQVPLPKRSAEARELVPPIKNVCWKLGGCEQWVPQEKGALDALTWLLAPVSSL